MKHLFQCLKVWAVIVCLSVQGQVTFGQNNADQKQKVKKIVRPHLSKTLEINEEQKVWVFDNLMSINDAAMMLDYSKLPLSSMRKENKFRRYSMTENSCWIPGETRWIAHVNRSEFEGYKVWKNAKLLIQRELGKEIYLEQVQAEFIQALDYKPPFKEEGCDENRYTAMLFIIPVWQYNNYGQLSFYSLVNAANKERLESHQAVQPKPARLVVWPSCLKYTSHPPTVNLFAHLSSVKLKFTTDKTSVSKSEEPGALARSKKSLGSRLSEFNFTNADANRQIDYGSHLRRTFHDSSDNAIYVFDDLFTHAELKQIKYQLLEHGISGLSNFDAGFSEDGDNVAVISFFSVEEFVETPLWTRVYELVCHVSGEDEWYPYDVSVNHVHSTDHTRIHTDAEQHQYEYTFLLYLNEGNGPEEFGETMFFERGPDDGVHGFLSPGGEVYEPIAAVWPKYGRVVLFRNIIQHSARPLGTRYLGNRYSFAVKVSRNRRLSLVKQIYETMEHVDVDERHSALSRKLQAGGLDSEASSRISSPQLEKLLKKLQKSVIEEQTENIMIYSSLLQGKPVDHLPKQPDTN